MNHESFFSMRLLILSFPLHSRNAFPSQTIIGKAPCVQMDSEIKQLNLSLISSVNTFAKPRALNRWRGKRKGKRRSIQDKLSDKQEIETSRQKQLKKFYAVRKTSGLKSHFRTGNWNRIILAFIGSERKNWVIIFMNMIEGGMGKERKSNSISNILFAFRISFLSFTLGNSLTSHGNAIQQWCLGEGILSRKVFHYCWECNVFVREIFKRIFFDQTLSFIKSISKWERTSENF